MAAATWRGAVEFNGFPINVALWPKVKSSRGESFKTLAPNGEPIKQVYQDSDGNPVDRSETSKGVEVSKGAYRALSAEAVERIQEGEKSSVLGASYFAPIDTVPLEMATQSYFVRADEKVAGADRSVNVLWNGMRAQKLAYVTQATLKAGSPDVVLALWADDQGLHAVALPFQAQLYPAPEGEFTEDAAAAELFEQFIDEPKPFALSDFTSKYSENRKQVIDAELAGEAAPAPAPKEQEAAVPDLMAALKASVDKKKSAKKPTTKEKVSA